MSQAMLDAVNSIRDKMLLENYNHDRHVLEAEIASLTDRLYSEGRIRVCTSGLLRLLLADISKTICLES